VKNSSWQFLSNHGYVLLCLGRDPDARLRDVARQVGITERAVQKIVADLEEAGVVTRSRQGRRNHYQVHPQARLRHPLESGSSVEDLLRLLAPRDGRAPEGRSGGEPRGDSRERQPEPHRASASAGV
jgi:predicted ArsR family transcriptional regulator